MSSKITELVGELVAPILTQEQMDLVDIEYKKEGNNRFLRLYVDKEGGVDIADCERVSEQLSKKLDEADPIRETYFLEVSSPGAERPLKNERDYTRAVGRNVFISTYAPVDGHKSFEGTLTRVTDTHLVVEVDGKPYELPRDQVAKARLAVVF